MSQYTQSYFHKSGDYKIQITILLRGGQSVFRRLGHIAHDSTSSTLHTSLLTTSLSSSITLSPFTALSASCSLHALSLPSTHALSLPSTPDHMHMLAMHTMLTRVSHSAIRQLAPVLPCAYTIVSLRGAHRPMRAVHIIPCAWCTCKIM